MPPSLTVQAARQFLQLVWEGEPPKDEELVAALDRLLAAYHDTPSDQPSDGDRDAPRQDYDSLRSQLVERFPKYGFYPTADATAPLDAPAMVGDAIDDLADLTLDMRDVVWLADHQAVADAHWYFRLHYFHWGLHARELALYLHARA